MPAPPRSAKQPIDRAAIAQCRVLMDFMPWTSNSKPAFLLPCGTLKGSGDPKSRIVQANLRCGCIAICRTQKPWVVVPCAAAKNVEAAIPGGDRRAIVRRAFIGRLVAVLNPLPDVAMHLVQAEGIARQRTGID